MEGNWRKIYSINAADNMKEDPKDCYGYAVMVWVQVFANSTISSQESLAYHIQCWSGLVLLAYLLFLAYFSLFFTVSEK